MENSFLLKFLELGLFDIGEQDDRLDQLQSAIEKVKSDLTQHQAKIPQYILVALDKDISPDEPVLLEVEKQVTQHWKTLRQRHKDRPVALLRGVILNALFELGNENPQFARIIYLIGSNFYPFASLGKEKELVFDQLQSFNEKAESEAVSNWALKEDLPSLRVSSLEIVLEEDDEVEYDIDSEPLKASLNKAASNGHNPYQHQAQWAQLFSEGAAKGISTAIGEMLSKVQSSLPILDIETSINNFFADFSSSLNQTLQTSLSSLMVVERRSKLLWWKETLYSQSQRKSYRDITKVELLPIIMTYDLLEQLPNITPVSVDYLLRDMFFLLLAKKDKKTTFSDYFKTMQEHQDTLTQYFQDTPNPSGRISITDFVGLLVHERVKMEDFNERTGIGLGATIKPSDLSVVLLHDFLCQRLINN